MDSGDLRAGDADRDRVAERLRLALDEGRLNLHEYDERLRDAYGAKTYAELDRLIADLPPVTPASRSRLARTAGERGSSAGEPAAGGQPDATGRYPGATRRWVVTTWDSWLRANSICLAIWAGICISARDLTYFWPVWVAGPWGIVLLVQTVSGLGRGEPQRWAARQARKQAEREVRRAVEGSQDPD